jgi:hypothetical protein
MESPWSFFSSCALVSSEGRTGPQGPRFHDLNRGHFLPLDHLIFETFFQRLDDRALKQALNSSLSLCYHLCDSYISVSLENRQRSPARIKLRIVVGRPHHVLDSQNPAKMKTTKQSISHVPMCVTHDETSG